MRVFTRPVRLAFAAGLLAIASSGPAAPAHAAANILGGGSSFAAIFHDQWSGDVGRPPLGLGVTYQASGSNQGRSQFANGQFDFAGSDTPYLSTEAKPGRPFVYVPVMAGGLAFMFRIEGANGSLIPELNLDARTVCRIFTDPTLQWNDAAILEQNPALVPVLPAIPVQPIVRADGSGTSYVLSEFCIATSPDVWNTFISFVRSKPDVAARVEPEFWNGRPISQWPTQWGPGNDAAGSDGVADAVSQTYDGLKGKITYVEYGAALLRDFPVAKMRNGAGAYVLPADPNVEVALGYASANLDSAGELDGTFTLAYSANDARAYFPSTYSYVVAPLNGDSEKLTSLTQYLQYAVTDGQRDANDLGYDPLSCEITVLALKQTAKIPGAGAVNSCRGAVDANTVIVVSAVAAGTVSNPSGSSTAGAGAAPGGANQAGVSTGSDQAAAGSAGEAGGGAPGAAGASGSSGSSGAAPASGSSATAGASSTGAQAAGGVAGATTTTAAGGATAAGGSDTDTGVAAGDGTAATADEAAIAVPPAAGGGTGSRRASAAVASSGTSGGSAAAGNDALVAANQAPNLSGNAAGTGGPSNADVLWTLLAGATLAAAGIVFARHAGAAP